jgi:hydrogenase-4 membrane subunit HyfE
VLLLAFRALGRTWPALLAWFLAGWIAHLLLLELAARLGAIQALYGFLILPLAVLARLASLVGMFLTVRPGLAHFPAGERREDRTAFWREWIEVLLESILPFFIIYAAWGLIDEDIVTYGSLSTQQSILHIGEAGYSNTPLSIPFGWLSVSLIVGAFIAKAVLKRLEERLPHAVGLVAAYAEAVWVLVSIFVLRGVLDLVPGWLSTRRMFAGIADLVAGLRASHGWFGPLVDAIGWLLGELGTVVGQPLAWIALAGVVYARALATLPARELGGRRRRIRERYESLPHWMQRGTEAASEELRERWFPILDSIRLLGRTGPIVIGTYLVAFAVVDAGRSWLQYGITRLLGPHDLGWWTAAQEPMTLVIDVVVTVLEVVLVATVFDRALGHAQARAREPLPLSAVAAPAEPAGKR